MTLHTVVHLRGPISMDDAFDLSTRSLLTAADAIDRHSEMVVERNPDWYFSRVGDYVGTVPGQGLPAWMDAQGNPDGSDFAPDGPDEDGEVYGDQEPWTVSVSWDTGYAYRGDRGESCSQLHGAALSILHRSLPDGVTLRWENEFTGEWHSGLDGLAGFAGEGVAARQFGALVLAAVVAGATKEVSA